MYSKCGLLIQPMSGAGKVIVDPRDFRTAAVVSGGRTVSLQSGERRPVSAPCHASPGLASAPLSTRTPARAYTSICTCRWNEPLPTQSRQSPGSEERWTLAERQTSPMCFPTAASRRSLCSCRCDRVPACPAESCRLSPRTSLKRDSFPAASFIPEQLELLGLLHAPFQATSLILNGCNRAWRFQMGAQGCRSPPPARRCGRRCAATLTPRYDPGSRAT